MMTSSLSPALTLRIANFQDLLHGWFALHQRPLPWRQDYSPYAVWISEIMLQQTQMERGVAYFERWMARFPDVRAVAEAPEEEILRMWEGLGYYSRARHLHKAAQQIMARHGGVFPSSPEAIRALPGVGPYTAGAIASIAFGADEPCIDANVERVVARVFDIDSPLKEQSGASLLRQWATALLPQGQARTHNQAMMELGALVCRKKALCPACPLAGLCESHHLNIVAERPVPGKSRSITQLSVVTGMLCHKDAYFLQQRLDRGVWGRLWEFPGGRIEPGESPEQAIVREFMEETGFEVRIRQPLGIIRHGYTTYRITLHCFALELASLPPAATVTAYTESPTEIPPAHPDQPAPPRLTAATAYRWLKPAPIQKLPLPAAHRKLADQVFGNPLQP